jgi:F-type H+-transporting ATPase subunit gamma
MRKAQAQALASREYSKLSSSLLESLAGKVNSEAHPLLTRLLKFGETPSGKSLVILVSPEGGLAGALNSNLIAKTAEIIKAEGRENLEFVTVGKKGADVIHRLGFKVIASFDSKNYNLSVFDAKPIAQIAIDDYLANKYSQVFIVFTDFVSTLIQRPKILRLLPLTLTSDEHSQEYLFEPDPDAVWDKLVYRTIEFAVYQTLTEAAASEHSARMVAMRNAHEASVELIDELQLTYNQARQAGITSELSEISAAKLAMEG